MLLGPCLSVRIYEWVTICVVDVVCVVVAVCFVDVVSDLDLLECKRLSVSCGSIDAFGAMSFSMTADVCVGVDLAIWICSSVRAAMSGWDRGCFWGHVRQCEYMSG